MKTSFYFLIWILIYPLLDLLGINSGEYSLLLALIAVIVIGYLVNRLLGSINKYSRELTTGRYLELVYTGNVKAFTLKIKQELYSEFFCSIYLLIATTVILAITLIEGVNGWVEFAIFGVITYGAISRTLLLQKAYRRLRENPTAEECMNVAVDVLNLPYAEFYEARQCRSFVEMLPPRPRFFTCYEWFAIIISALTGLLGTWILMWGFIMIMAQPYYLGAGFISLAYGALAIYFGIKDLIGSIRDMRKLTPSRSNSASPTESSNN